MRVAKIKQKAGKVAVPSCLEKAKLAAESKDTDPALAVSWYYATLEKLEECKDSISPVT